MDGVLLVNKENSCTSHDVVIQVRNLLGGVRVGHTGTLDPMATGLLPLTIGEATKLCHWLMGGDKRYRATVHLGTETDTLDKEGREISRQPIPPLCADRVDACLQSFVGESQQTPPMHSALHHQGRRLYDLAREGKTVPRLPRTIHIHSISLLFHSEETLEIDVVCSAGTYIRSLALDIAKRLGTVGHLAALERTETGGWKLSQSISLPSCDGSSIKAGIIPLESVLERFQRIEVSEAVCRRLCLGQHPSLEEMTSAVIDWNNLTNPFYFYAGADHPIVLAKTVEPKNPAENQWFEILRVLRPPQPETTRRKGKKAEENR
jgi:tRNA pseudouridine55 synthase